MLVYIYVAGEGVELTVHKESVVVEKIKEAELRSRRVQLFRTEVIIELGHSHAPSRLQVKKLRRLLHERRKVRVFVWKSTWKISLPGPSRRLAPVLKCRRFLSFFQRYIVRDILLTEIYRWLTEILSAILTSTRHGGQSRERLVYERKFKSEYLERQIYERSLKS